MAPDYTEQASLADIRAEGPDIPGQALLIVTLRGLLRQMRKEDGTPYQEQELAEIIGESPQYLSNLLARGRGITADKLGEIQERLHAWAAANYDEDPREGQVRRAPDDHRRVLLPELFARVHEDPRAARCRVPAAWFRELATAVLDRASSPAPVVAIAAGQSLVLNIEMLDQSGRQSSKAVRKELVTRLQGDRDKATMTIDALLNVAELPPALFGTEALFLLGRIRTTDVLSRVHQRIRTRGAGFRLWRALSVTLKVERKIAETLATNGNGHAVRTFLRTQSALPHVDEVLWSLLTDPPEINAYPARSLHIEALRQRLLLRSELVEVQGLTAEDIDYDDRNTDVHALAINQLRDIVRDHSTEAREPRTGRERAYAACVLHELDEEVPRSGSRGGLLGYAVAKMTDPRSEAAQQAERELNRAMGHVTDALDVRIQRGLVPRRLVEGDGQEVLVTLVRIMVGSYDGVARRRVADCLRSAMLRHQLMTPLCAIARDATLPLWVRENAVLALSFLGAGSGDSEEDIEALDLLAGLLTIVGTDDEETHLSFVHAAAWALGDSTLVRLSRRRTLKHEHLATFAVVRHRLYEASESQYPQVRRAAVHGMVCIRPLEVPTEMRFPTTADDVERRLKELSENGTDPDPDPTVRALIDQPLHISMIHPAG